MSATATARNGSRTTPVAVVKDFLLALQDGKLDRAFALLADDVAYTNVSLPTLRGRRGVERALRMFFPRAGFRVHFVNVAATGDVVLTERVDAMVFGRVEQRFWVCGRFEVRDGKITVWRDAFDWADLTVGLVRGLLGALSPRLNRRWPG